MQQEWRTHHIFEEYQVKVKHHPNVCQEQVMKSDIGWQHLPFNSLSNIHRQPLFRRWTDQDIFIHNIFPQNIAPRPGQSSPFNEQNTSAPHGSSMQPIGLQWTPCGLLPIYFSKHNVFPSYNFPNLNKLHIEKNEMKTEAPKWEVQIIYEVLYHVPVDSTTKTNNRQDADHSHHSIAKIAEEPASRVEDIEAVTHQQHGTWA